MSRPLLLEIFQSSKRFQLLSKYEKNLTYIYFDSYSFIGDGYFSLSLLLWTFTQIVIKIFSKKMSLNQLKCWRWKWNLMLVRALMLLSLHPFINLYEILSLIISSYYCSGYYISELSPPFFFIRCIIACRIW